MADLVTRLSEHAQKRALFPDPGLALLAVSGGPDSVALADLLAAAGTALGLSLAIAHVDHGIASDSAAVADGVRALAARYGVPFHLATLALGAGASETRARRERYRALRAAQRELGARYLVTAHQADDQVETVLYRILRGSGPAGLAGIPTTGPDGLVRPLLPFSRAELKGWLDARMAAGAARFGIHTDPANFDPRHDRSWLRHNVLPVLRTRVGPALDGHLINQARHAARERRAWAEALRALERLDFRATAGAADVARGTLLTYDKALALALLRSVAREAGCALGPRRANRALRFARDAQSGRAIELGGGWVAEVVFERLRFRRAEPESDAPAEASWGGAARGEARLGAWTLRWCPEAAGAAERGSLVTWVTPGAGTIRPWTKGDRVRPLGGVGHRAVSRLLMEARVPRVARRVYPMVVRDGAVLWIPGVCRSAAAVPAPGATALRLEASANGST